MRRAALTGLLAALVFGGTATPALANERPVVQSDFYSMSAGTVLEVPAPGVLGNDVDPDGDVLTIYPDLLPGGPVDLRPDGSFTFTPPPGFTGTFYSFDYYAFDGQIVNNCCAHVYITIYPDAVAVDDQYAALNTGPRTVPSPGVLANDTGVAVRLKRPAVHGTVVLGRTGGFTYTAQPGYVGIDSFTYRTYSGFGTTLSPPATVTIRV
ncbi:MAG: Ig-like domain-containing protein, partial [Actinomycetota bacterium]|nr:Ig-like domain-containing protein [Actinomycetota bacterium]